MPLLILEPSKLLYSVSPPQPGVITPSLSDLSVLFSDHPPRPKLTPSQFLPGQWVDLHIPSLPSPGGFTITSAPSAASIPPTTSTSASTTTTSTTSTHSHAPHLELAIQHTTNPPAQWLWQPPALILHTTLHIQPGGSFTWPPRRPGPAAPGAIDRVLLVAGGVGINPFASMLAALAEARDAGAGVPCPRHVVLLYSSRRGAGRGETLFLARAAGLLARYGAGAAGAECRVQLHVTGPSGDGAGGAESESEGPLAGEWGADVLTVKAGRIGDEDLERALGPREARGEGRTVAYVCGPPAMVNEMAGKIGAAEGMSAEQVFVERWC